jgi:hypothetical protein
VTFQLSMLSRNKATSIFGTESSDILFYPYTGSLYIPWKW